MKFANGLALHEARGLRRPFKAWLAARLSRVGKVTGVLGLAAVVVGCASVTLLADSEQSVAPAIPKLQPAVAVPSTALPSTRISSDTADVPPVTASVAQLLPDSLTGSLAAPPAIASEKRVIQRGGASWYGTQFHGRRTASGERYDMYALTAAHRTLPFGTVIRVRSQVNGREVKVRINDRGPFTGLRIIDLSRAAAVELGMLGLGVKNVVLLGPDAGTVPADEAVAPAPPLFSPG